MNLHKLEVFCEAVERGSLTATAEHLAISQPVVSAHIRDLERDFGAKLLRAEGRRMIPTDAGSAVYAYALDVRRGNAETRRFAAALEAGDAGRVTLAASHGPGGYLVPRLLAEFRRAHPEAELSLAVGGSQHVLDGVQQGAYDFGVVTAAEGPPALALEVLTYEPLAIIAAADHPLASSRGITPEQLRAETFVFPFAPRTQAWVRSSLRQLGVAQPRISMTLGSWEALKAGVASGAGIALAYRFCLDAQTGSGRLVMLDVAGPALTQPLMLVRVPDRRLTLIQERLCAFVREEMQKRNSK